MSKSRTLIRSGYEPFSTNQPHRRTVLQRLRRSRCGQRFFSVPFYSYMAGGQSLPLDPHSAMQTPSLAKRHWR